jgi:hypothetical protein
LVNGFVGIYEVSISVLFSLVFLLCRYMIFAAIVTGICASILFSGIGMVVVVGGWEILAVYSHLDISTYKVGCSGQQHKTIEC